MQAPYTPHELLTRTDLPWQPVTLEMFKPAKGGIFYGFHFSLQTVYFDEGDFTFIKDIVPLDPVEYAPGLMVLHETASAELGLEQVNEAATWPWQEY